MGNNANGIKAKQKSLLNTLNFVNLPSCVLIQESKLRFPGTFKLKGYQIFEQVRSSLGGGLLTAVDPDLSPVLISTGKDSVEILVVQVQIGKLKVRIFNAYGPQESEKKETIQQFWFDFEKQIIDAKEQNCCIMIGMDANAKLGLELISEDPN